MHSRHGAVVRPPDRRRRLSQDLRQLSPRRGRRHPVSNRGPGQSLMASNAWTRYKLMRKLFAVGEDFWIENDRGEAVFKVDGKALSLRHKFLVEEQAGGVLLSVQSKLVPLQAAMRIERQGQLYATVTKALFTLFHQHYTIQVEGGPAIETDGDITNAEYEVPNNGTPVAQISRQWF